MRVLIAGCGYVGLALGLRLRELGHAVVGLRRPGSDVAPLVRAGIEPAAGDLTQPATLAGLADFAPDGLVFAAAPDHRDGATYRALYRDGAVNLLHALATRPPRRCVVVSSAAVYAQTDGSRVDETSATEPADLPGQALLEAEHAVRSPGEPFPPAVVLRVAGIYGPGRSRIGAIRSGEARSGGDGRRRVNLIHRDDLVSAIVAALERGTPGSVYNVCDGVHPTEDEFLGWLCARLGVPRPPAGEVAMPGRRTRPFTNKCVAADRLRTELGWVPAFPDFRAGHEALLAEAAVAGLGTTAARQRGELPPP